MGSFLLSFGTNATLNGGQPIELEVLIGGSIVSSVVINNADESNSLLLDYAGSAPSSFSIRFASGSGNSGDNVTFTSLNINNAPVNLGIDLSSTMLLVAQNTNITADNTLYGHTVPTIGSPTKSGTNGNEGIFGGNAADIIDGLAGDDRILGRGNDDSLNGGAGNDTLFGEAGNDTVLGGSGNDVIYGNEGNDILYGEEGNDRIIGGVGEDIINGGIGIDRLIGDAGNDTIFGEGGDDRLYGNDGDDLLFGDEGNDILSGGNGNDSIAGGIGNDRIFGGAGDDLTAGGVGDDEIYTGAGDDIINGGDGADIIVSGIDLDVVLAEGGNDTIYLLDGEYVAGEYIDGGADTDTLALYGGVNIDFRIGTVSNFETLTGSTTSDTVTFSAEQFFQFNSIDYDGGTNTQTIIISGTNDVSTLNAPSFSNASTTNLVTSTGAEDLTIRGDQLNSLFVLSPTLDFQGGSDILNLVSTSTTLNSTSDANLVGLETISAAAGIAGVTIDLRNQTEALTITGSNFDDTITGGTGSDTLNGGAGNDTINSSFGDIADTIDGGTGTSDTLSYADASGGIVFDLAITSAQDTEGAGVDTVTNIENVTGSGFNDTLDGNSGNNIIIGGNGNDEIEGHGGNDTLNGGGGSSDVVTYESASSGITVNLSNLGAQNTGGAGTDTLSNFENIIGSNHNDNLTGDGSSNIMTGGSGNDTLNGGGGNDTLLGGDDNDILNGGAGNDTLYGATIIGQSGVETVIQTDSSQWHSVTFAATITNPIIKMSNMTNNDGDFYVVRVRSVTDSGFEWQIDEFDYLDGSRTLAEDVSWIAVASGTHTLNNGSIVQAGTTTATNEAYTNISFNSAFGSAPVVMTQVMTDNDSSAIGTRNRSRTTTGFQMQMLEEEAADGVHATETIGWIAIDNGGSVADGFLVAETGNSVRHPVTTINFGSSFSNTPVFVHDQQTRDGGDTSYSQADGVTTSQARVFIGEEQSRDNEVNHTTEIVGYYALNEGLLTAQGGGDNTLSGGDGLDTLFGGDGADTYVFEAANAFNNVDILADFSAGENDSLDISDILSGVSGINSGNITNYINFDDSSGTDTIVQVDIDGVGGVGFQSIAQITGITGLNEVTLFNNGNIAV